MPQLASASLGILNVGPAQFAETIAAAGGHATQLEFLPPALAGTAGTRIVLG